MVFRLLVLVLALAATQAPLRPGVDLVHLDVVVVDDSGRPVADLRPNELAIEEAGKRLPVLGLQRVTQPAATSVDAAVRGLSAEISSNDGAPGGHLYILVFDQHHLSPADEPRARLVAEEFIRRRVGSADRVAVFGIPDPGPLVGFTANRARAIQALDSVRGMRQASVSAATSRAFLRRLADLVAQFRELEGRKTVALFSAGFQDDLTPELTEVAAAAAQCVCVFYTFDLHQSGRGEIRPGGPLARLALETGGVMVPDAGTHVAEALDRLPEQPHEYYRVGFAPDTAKARPGTYQRVSVNVARAGARVLTRTGYALPPAPTAEGTRDAINTILGAPFAQQALRIDYATYMIMSPEPGQQRLFLTLDVDLPVRHTPSDTADVVFVARDVRDGRVAASGADTIPLPATSRPGGASGTAHWRTHFDLPAGSYVMRAVVRDPHGLAGSADRRIDVHPLDGPSATASDLVVGAVSEMPARPRVRANDRLSGLIDVYGHTAADLDGLAVTVELRGADNAAVTTAGATPSPTTRTGTMVSRRATFELTLADVPAGDYIAHATITARGGVIAERTRRVEVIGGRGTTPVAASSSISPLEVTRADLGQKFIGFVGTKARGTSAAEAAAHAAAGRWDLVDPAVANAGTDDMAMNALKGLALFVREDYKGAAAALGRALTLEQHPLTAFVLGWVHEGAGDSRAAVSAWQTAVRLDPSLVSAHLALADGYLKLSQPDLAVQALRSGLAAIPGSVELRTRLQQIERIPQAAK